MIYRFFMIYGLSAIFQGLNNTDLSSMVGSHLNIQVDASFCRSSCSLPSLQMQLFSDTLRELCDSVATQPSAHVNRS